MMKRLLLFAAILSTIIGQMEPTKEPQAFYQYSLDLIDNEILGAAGIWVGVTTLSDANESMQEQSANGSTFTLDQSYGENGDIHSVAIEKDDTSLLLTILVIDEIVNKLFIKTYFEFDGSVESRKHSADMFELALQNRVNNLGQSDNPIPGLYVWSNSKADYHLLRVESESGGYFISEVIFLNSLNTESIETQGDIANWTKIEEFIETKTEMDSRIIPGRDDLTDFNRLYEQDPLDDKHRYELKKTDGEWVAETMGMEKGGTVNGFYFAKASVGNSQKNKINKISLSYARIGDEWENGFNDYVKYKWENDWFPLLGKPDIDYSYYNIMRKQWYIIDSDSSVIYTLFCVQGMITHSIHLLDKD
jgi:hypothetical protein